MFPGLGEIGAHCREVASYEKEEDAIERLRNKWRERKEVPTAPVEDLWFTSVGSDTTAPEEPTADAAAPGDPIVPDAPVAVKAKPDPALLRDWDASNVEELLHSDELEEFNKLLEEIAETEMSLDVRVQLLAQSLKWF